MIDVIDMFTREEQPDAWCAKYYHAGVFPTFETPLWGVRSSAWSGIVACEVVPLKGNQPLDGLWRLHYASLVKKMERLGLSKFDIDSQDDLKRRIAILCQRNHYPQNSLAHILAWREGHEISGKTDYAIFQQKLTHPAFEDNTKRIILDATPEETISLTAGPWADIAIESAARRKTAETSKARNITFAGMALLRPDGLVARTTLGNIYVTHGRKITTVKEGEGASPCALRPFLKTAIEEINSQNDPRLAITYEEVAGLDNTLLTTANGCFVLDNTVGLAPILRFRTTYGNELTRTLAEKFRGLF